MTGEPGQPTPTDRAAAYSNAQFTGIPVPIEFDNPRAKFVSESLERLDAVMAETDWSNPAKPLELQCELANAHATLALAQEVANLRQMLEKVLDQ